MAQIFKPVFVENRNTRNFVDMMLGLERGAGEGRLAVVYGPAGRGKTRTIQWWHASEGDKRAYSLPSVYLRVLTVWRGSEAAFLKALCFELGCAPMPRTASTRFDWLREKLIASPQAVFLDEIEKLPRHFLEIVRDLTDLTGSPFVLCGEDALLGQVSEATRVWSRTIEKLYFEPLDKSDVKLFAKTAAGVDISPDVANVLNTAAGGDFRIVKRDLGALIRLMKSKNTAEATIELAQAAIRAGVRGRRDGK
jgi:hypothetical protein